VKRKLVTGGAVAVALLVAAGVAFAIWAMQARVHTTVNISAKPAIGIVSAFTNDDGAGNNEDIDPADTGLDPSSIGPKPTRYSKDIGSCTATSDGSADGTLTVTGGYGGYYCQLSAAIASSSPTTVQAVRWGDTALTDCPTMTEIDTDDDLSPDLALCVQAMDGTSTVPLLGHALGGTAMMAFVELHVLDTASPSQAIDDVITVEGGALQ
jgi:hypothetical protein